MSWQKGILFVAGVALGVGAGVVGVMTLREGGGPHALLATHAMGAAPAAQPAASAAVVPVVQLDAHDCELSPILPRKGSGDGQISLQAHPKTGSDSDVAALILGGKEADASGRQRDAEVAFLNACRHAALVQGNPIPLADAMYQLARHYANAAAFGAQPAREIFDRAERLYSASLLTYQARLGARSEKTKFAAEGLKTVQQVTGRNGPVTPVAKAPAPAPAVVAKAPAPAPAAVAPAPARAPVVQPAPVAAAPAPAAPAAPAPAAARNTAPAPEPVAVAPKLRHTNPSFDCARAHSTNEKLICGDEDLARQDRELGALHARAKQAAADPRAFQRESDAQWSQREQTCKDRDCLERWYAKRRAELAAAAAGPVHAPTASHRAPARSEREAMGGAAAPAAPDIQPAPVHSAAPHVAAPRRAVDDSADDQAPPPRRARQAAGGSAVPADDSSPGTASGSAGDTQ